MTSFSMQMETGDFFELESTGPNASDPYMDTVKSEQIQFLHETLGKLQKNCRISIRLFYMEQFSYKEISDALGISINTVGSRISKCLNKLRRELRKKTLLERSPQ